MKALTKILFLALLGLVGGALAQVFTGMATSGIGSGIIGNPVSAAGNFSATPPYFYDGTNHYVAATGYTATFPSGSPTWINSVTPTVTAGTNGDLLFTGTGAYWAKLSGTTSTEAEFTSLSSATAAATDVGVWMYDSTNSRIWAFSIESETASSPSLIVNSYVYSGTGNPAFQMNFLKAPVSPSQVLHFKLSKVSTTLHFQVSLNGGANFTDVLTESIGTLADGGYFGVGAGGSGAVIGDVYSLVVN